MIRVVSTNITSPLGFTTEENYLAVKSGKSSLAVREHPWGIPERVCASLFTDAQWKALSVEGMTGFESLAVRSIREALQRTDMDVSSPRVVLIISSTKGNIEIMADGGEYVSLAESARRIASATGVTTSPVVVCNACISGASAQLLALRLLEAGRYDKAVVCGADCVGKFVVSGFSSLKALSQEPCRPFDIDRYGLNLGEAAATVIFSREEDGAVNCDYVHWFELLSVSRRDFSVLPVCNTLAESDILAPALRKLYSDLQLHEQDVRVNPSVRSLIDDFMERTAPTT
jgi:3-oxoacyl-[acyl-carrier-protein] synthase-1